MLLDHHLADERAVPARTACRDDDVIEVLQLVLAQIESAELGESVFVHGAAAHRVLDALRLLHDLLQHEVREAALLDLLQIPIDAADAFLDRLRIEVGDAIGIARQHCHLTVVQVHHVTRVLENGRHIACNVVRRAR